MEVVDSDFEPSQLESADRSAIQIDLRGLPVHVLALDPKLLLLEIGGLLATPSISSCAMMENRSLQNVAAFGDCIAAGGMHVRMALDRGVAAAPTFWCRQRLQALRDRTRREDRSFKSEYGTKVRFPGIVPFFSALLTRRWGAGLPTKSR